MRAIIFAAGLGTRLQPLTNSTPKALVKLNGKPLLWHAINKLIDSGASEIIVNVHHFGQQIIDYLAGVHFDIPIFISDERHVLLDTGGGILKAKSFLSKTESFIAFNVDVISSVDIKKAIMEHQKSNALATVIVRQRETSRYLMFDESMNLSGWINKSNGAQKISNESFAVSSPFAFSGIQIISSDVFNHITETGKFSIIDLYLRLAQNHVIKGFYDQSDYWLDLGKPGQIEQAEKLLNQLQAGE